MTKILIRALVLAARRPRRHRARIGADVRIRTGDAAQPPGKPGAPAHRHGGAVAVSQSAARAAARRAAQPQRARRNVRRLHSRNIAQPQSYPQQQAYPQQAYPQQQPYPQQGILQQESRAAPHRAARRPARRCVRSEPEPECSGRSAHARPARHGRGRAAARRSRQATSRHTSALPAAVRPASRSISAIMAEEAANMPPPRREVRTIPGALPPPPPRNPSGTGAQQMVMAPTNTPKDEYDLAYGYVLRKDYALAEEGLRAFLKKYPNDRLRRGRELLARRKPVPAPALSRSGGVVPRPCRPSSRAPARRRTRCCGSASRLRR